MRRVVTGTSTDGTTSFVHDGPAPNVLTSATMPGVEMALLWSTDGTVEVPNSGDESTSLDQEFYPTAGGTRFMAISYPPGFGLGEPSPDVHTEFSDMAEKSSFDQLLLHATDTVDYAIVLSGELCSVLESGEERRLAAGDILVQNGVAHGWRNRSSDVAVVAFVIVGAHHAHRVNRTSGD